MPLKTLNDLGDLNGKKVFLRVDFNVPLDGQGNVRDSKRIAHAVPTIKLLLEKGVSQIIMASHLGRPKNNESTLMTNKVASTCAELVGVPVKKVDNWGEEGLPSDKLIMLENIRFHSAEKSKDENERDDFGKQLAGLADVYVNEAFSNSHRKHASMTSIPKFLPGCVGLGVEKEVMAITRAVSTPEKPLIAVIGGLKADKINAIYNLMNVADKVLVAGALACCLLKAKGFEIGSSKSDDEGMEEKANMVNEVIKNSRVELPTDFIVADDFSVSANLKNVASNKIEPGWMALDIGAETAKNYATQISQAKTVLWFGPIGVFEMKPFAHGTQAVAQAMAALNGATTIIGGGDSASAVKKFDLIEKMSLVSTGGGASLEMIEGKELPALKVLTT